MEYLNIWPEKSLAGLVHLGKETFNTKNDFKEH